MTYAVFKGLERNVVPRTRQRILDETYFGHTILRCYLYSKEDALIAWQDKHEQLQQEGMPAVAASDTYSMFDNVHRIAADTTRLFFSAQVCRIVSCCLVTNASSAIG
jgi:hypothetical protein